MSTAYKKGGVRGTIGKALTVKLPPRVFRVRLTGFLFESDKTFVLPAAMHGIKGLASLYSQHPNMSVLITGHTDREGPDSYNLALADARAASVAEFLQDRVAGWTARYRATGISQPWGAREDQYMLSAVPRPSGAGTYLDPKLVSGWASAAAKKAMADFQRDQNVARSDGVADAPTRTALVTAYMALEGTSLPSSAHVERHACGPFHNAVPTGPGVANQDNRRVEIFLMDGPIDPAARAKCPGPAGCPEYPEWVRRTRQTFEFDKDIVEDQPLVTKFFGRPQAHDARSEEPHTLIVPARTPLVLHWEVVHATKVAIRGNTLEGDSIDVPLPAGGSILDDHSLISGSVVVSPDRDLDYVITASNDAASVTVDRVVQVDVYDGSGATLDVGEDFMALGGAGSASSSSSSSSQALVGSGLKVGFVPQPSGPSGIQTSHTDFLELKSSSEVCANLAVDDFRARIKSTLRAAQNFGVDDHPAGRFDVYLDLVSWDTLGRNAMKPRTGAASSCGMFIRMMWFLLGARGAEMNEAFTFNRIIRLVLDYAGSAAKDPVGVAPNPPDPSKFTAADFKPSVGDVIYLFRQKQNPNWKPPPAAQPPADPANPQFVADQHIFTIIKVVPDDDPTTGFTTFSVDAGNDGPGSIDSPNNGIHLVKRHFTTGGPGKPNLFFDGSARPIRSWIKIAEMQSKFTANRIELVRNAAQIGPTQNNQPVVGTDPADAELGP